MAEQAENRLETLLRLAAGEPAHRPEFYQVLLASQVFLLGEGHLEEDGSQILKPGSSVALQHWEKADGGPIIPFFSSLETLQASIEAEQSWLAMPARAFFELTQGAELVLNPMSAHGKEFVPDEVAMLLRSGINRVPEHRVVERETQVVLGQPKEAPKAMLESLATLLAKHRQVSRGFLAFISDVAAEENPHLIVGLEIEGGEAEAETVIMAAGAVVCDTAPDDHPVDICRVEAGVPGLSQYFLRNVAPFYTRS